MSKISSVLKKGFQYYLWSKNQLADTENRHDYVLNYKTVSCDYVVRKTELPPVSGKYKWVGGQWLNNTFYGVPNDENSLLIYDQNEVKINDSQYMGRFKWTGGCIWNDKLYCFPRAKNSFLIYDLITGTTKEKILPCRYCGEHHYGGVRTHEGIVYQPPRNTDHILVTNLNDFTVKKIPLAPSWMKMRLRYCGSVLHPNGYIFFLPENGQKVIRLNPLDETWCYIGSAVSPLVFDAKAGHDGNIYGFSAYYEGILKIDVAANHVSMIHTEIKPGSYGTKIGINGKLYSIPGIGSEIYEYDIDTDNLRSIYHIHENTEVKYAGGAVNMDGTIIFTPAECNNLLLLKPNIDDYKISQEEYEKIYNDFY